MSTDQPQPTEPTPYRRTRGTIVEPVRAGWEIERLKKDKVTAIARRLHVSPSVFVEALIDQIELDLRGIPTWWPEQELADGEMPIDTA